MEIHEERENDKKTINRRIQIVISEYPINENAINSRVQITSTNYVIHVYCIYKKMQLSMLCRSSNLILPESFQNF